MLGEFEVGSVYLNAFRVIYTCSTPCRLRVFRFPLWVSRYMKILRSSGWICVMQPSDFPEENLKAGVYIISRGSDDEVTQLIKLMREAAVEEVDIVADNYIVKRFLMNIINMRLRGRENVVTYFKANTLTFVVKNDKFKVNIGSNLFSAYRGFDIRIEKALGSLLVVLDYHLKLFPPNIIELLDVLKRKNRLDVLYRAPIRCVLEDGEKREIIRGVIKEIRDFGDRYVLSIHGEKVLSSKDFVLDILGVGVFDVDSHLCSFMESPKHYKNLLHTLNEDYNSINRRIREESSLRPQKRYDLIMDGIKTLRALAFPITIDGISYDVEEEPYTLGVAL